MFSYRAVTMSSYCASSSSVSTLTGLALKSPVTMVGTRGAAGEVPGVWDMQARADT